VCRALLGSGSRRRARCAFSSSHSRRDSQAHSALEFLQLGENNFFSNLVAAGKVAENRIGLYISPVGSSGAEVTLGGVDSSRYTGKLQTLENKPLQGHVRSRFSASAVDLAAYAMAFLSTSGR